MICRDSRTDKLVDELAKGKPMEKILRSSLETKTINDDGLFILNPTGIINRICTVNSNC